jgi:hypothetical protein
MYYTNILGSCSSFVDVGVDATFLMLLLVDVIVADIGLLDVVTSLIDVGVDAMFLLLLLVETVVADMVLVVIVIAILDGAGVVDVVT